jgi:ribosomal-protein-alanine N-acetyltransferase
MPPFQQVMLCTPRLTLRWIDEDDAGALFDIFSQPAVMRYWSTPPWTAIAQSRAHIREVREAYANGSSMRFGVVLAKTGLLIGTVTLFGFHWPNRRAEIGFALARAYWGQGLMREALTASLSHAFDALHLHRIEADVDPRNTASGKLLVRLGFRQEGLLRERWIVGDAITDSALYGILARDWAGSRPGYPAEANGCDYRTHG